MKSRLRRVKALKTYRDKRQTGPSAQLLALLERVRVMSKDGIGELLKELHPK